MKSVFISYSSKDTYEIKQITGILEENKISYFKAPESIPAGSNYAREIPGAIRECAVFLLVISVNSQNSIWVEKEIDCAINMRRMIIPIKIGKEPLSDMFLFYLNNVQIINYYENPQNALKQLELRLSIYSNEQAEDREENDGLREENIKSPIDEEIENLNKQRKLNNRVVRYIENTDNNNKTGPANVFLDEHVSRSRLMKSNSSFTIADSSAHRTYAMKMNAISVNKIPIECEECGGDLIEIHRGTYRCVRCGYHNYDSFQKIRNYLAENGAKPSTVIAEDTGVPRNTVEYFLLEEHLEIPINSPVKIACLNCGAPIRTGRLCEKCKNANVVLSDSQLSKGVIYHFAGHSPKKP